MNFRLGLLLVSLVSASALTAAPLGHTNFVLALDGRSGCLEVADSPALHSLSNAMTLELWFKAGSLPDSPGRVSCLLRKNPEAGHENFFLRFRSADGRPVVEFFPGPRIGILRAPCSFKSGTWYHLAATYNGATATIFVNGTNIASAPMSGAISVDSSELLVGRGDPDYSGGEYFDGALDELRIWNVARSAAEIQASATTSLSGREPGLLAYWNFDDAQARELCGHGIDATLKGGAQIVASERPAKLEAVPAAEAPSPPPPLSSDKRQQIVEEFWQKLSATYPALEYKGISGREWIEPTLERVRQVKDDQEFYGLLLELIASLNDTHTRIFSYPGQPSLDSPPVFLNQVEGNVAVIRADESTGLKPGDVLVSIDGKPVADCLATKLKRVCGSTERARVRGACGQLLSGPPGSTVTIQVRTADQSIRQLTLQRTRMGGFMSEPVLSSRRLSDSLGYIRISQWGGADLAGQFDRALEEFKETRGLVIDVRGNGGGSDALADEVNGRLIDQPVVSSIDFWRESGTDQFHKTIGRVQPRGPWTYRGRVAVLIDEGCASACEHFVSGIEAMKRVLIVGTPTNGAGGGPTVLTLSDGTRFAVSRALGLRANGIVFEGHGIPPHIFSTPSLADLRDGRDAALDIAKNWIRSGEPVPTAMKE